MYWHLSRQVTRVLFKMGSLSCPKLQFQNFPVFFTLKLSVAFKYFVTLHHFDDYQFDVYQFTV